MTEKPNFPHALCNRCRYLGESTEPRYRMHYRACNFPVRIPAVLRMNGWHEGAFDRLIPRRELVGFADSSRYNNCPTFEVRPSQDAATKVEKPKETELIEVDPRLYDLLAPFRPEIPP